MGWTLAEAFERANMPDSAATRFVETAENRPAYRAWYTPRGFTDSFARRRAAMLLDATGRQEEAAEHWTEFLANFTDPDPAYAIWRTAAIERIGKAPGPDR